VLSRIDGLSSVQDLADLTALPIEQVHTVLEKLKLLGAIQWKSGKAATKPPDRSRTSRPPRPSNKPSAPPKTDSKPIRIADSPRGKTEAIPPPPAAPAEAAALLELEHASPAKPPDVIELSPERIARIDAIHPRLDVLDHYAVLGIPHTAELKAIRGAYFELSKVFHPDTAFRKNLGPYKAKMEAIFSRLTEAYEVLGKKKSRTEYDSYLALQGFTREAEAAMTGAPPPSPLPERPPTVAPPRARTAPPPTEAGPSAAHSEARPVESGPQSPTATMSEAGRKQARELLEMRLRRGRDGSASQPGAPRPAPSAVSSASRGRGDVLRELTSSLKTAALQTGGLDAVQRHALEARRLEREGDLAGAARELRLAVAMAPQRVDLKLELDRVSQELASQLAERYREQANYEERHRKWTAAALSWRKVVEGCPEDVEAMVHAARALLEAKGDMHEAQRLASLACEAQPHHMQARVVLGRVYLAAGLRLNAKRELERALVQAPGDPGITALLKAVDAS
jgi:curved DNA-binding protein CbpA